MNTGQLFDHYSFRARLQPALTALSPLAFAVIAWTGPSKPWMTALWTLAGSAGLTYFLAIIARNLGKAIEPTLWTRWGGAPTIQLLRYRGPANSLVRERWHATLAKLTGLRFPSADEESQDTTRADEIYEAAARSVVIKARESAKKHSLVYTENVQYGFCRNLYALRGVGIAFALVGLVASVAAGVNFHQSGHPTPIPWVCSTISALVLLCWLFLITSSWVRVPAFAYAHRLLESIEAPARTRTSKSSSGSGAQD